MLPGGRLLPGTDNELIKLGASQPPCIFLKSYFTLFCMFFSGLKKPLARFYRPADRFRVHLGAPFVGGILPPSIFFEKGVFPNPV